MKKLISFILPVYNESESIEAFYTELAAVADELKSRYEVDMLFINDGSTDESLEKLIKLHTRDKRVRIVNFSRNFGHQAALTAGTDIANGDAIIVMDTDLQDPPKVALDLVKSWEDGYHVVYAQRKKRKDNPFKLFAIHVHYRVLRSISDIEIPVDTGDFRLMDKRAVVALRKFGEKNRYIRGLVPYLGFRQTTVKYNRHGRFAGGTHYPFSKLVKLSLDGITSFSTVPLEAISRLGFFMFLFAMFGAFYVLGIRLLDPSAAVPGWAFTMIAILLMGGVQFITLGVMGTYIGRIYREVQNRPLYLISEIIEDKNPSDEQQAKTS